MHPERVLSRCTYMLTLHFPLDKTSFSVSSQFSQKPLLIAAAIWFLAEGAQSSPLISRCWKNWVCTLLRRCSKIDQRPPASFVFSNLCAFLVVGDEMWCRCRWIACFVFPRLMRRARRVAEKAVVSSKKLNFAKASQCPRAPCVARRYCRLRHGTSERGAEEQPASFLKRREKKNVIFDFENSLCTEDRSLLELRITWNSFVDLNRTRRE